MNSSWRSSEATRASQEPVLLTGGRRKSCNFCRDKVDQIDYKDFQSLRRYPVRQGQDPLAAHHRRLPAAPEPARERRQAGPRAGAPALRQRALGEREVAQAILLKDVEGLGEAGAVIDVSAGLPAQLPRSPQARAARDPSLDRGRPAPARAGRDGGARAGGARSGNRGAAVQDGADDLATAQARTAACSARSRRRRSPRRSGRRAGLRIDRRKVRLEEPIRELGTHMVEIEVTDERHGHRQDHGRRGEVRQRAARERLPDALPDRRDRWR